MDLEALRLKHRGLSADVLGRLLLEGGPDLSRPPVLGKHLKKSLPALVQAELRRPREPLSFLCSHGAPPCEACLAGKSPLPAFTLEFPIAGAKDWSLWVGSVAPFSGEDRAILEEIAVAIGYAAKLRLLLSRQFGQLAADFDSLVEATREISRCQDLEDLYTVVAEMGHRLLNLNDDHFLCLERYSALDQELIIVAVSGEDGDHYQGLRLAVTGALAGKRSYPRSEDGRPILSLPRQKGPPLTGTLVEKELPFLLVHDIEKRDSEAGYYHLNANTRSEIAMPIILDDGSRWGVLNVESPRPDNFSSGFDLPVLRGFARLISVFVQALAVRTRRRSLDVIAGLSDALKRVIHLSAQSREPVLITGETGTGKEVVARALHNDGPRRRRPFVPVNCGALESGLLMNELFGHSAHSYTGAGSKDKDGLFHAADGGTLFLDEIENMSAAVQEAVLRIVERGEVRRVGGTELEMVDVRILAATNVNLRTLIDQGRFRLDLYYRLKILEITLPPLRERRQAISPLVEQFIGELRRPLQEIQVDAEVMDCMLRYDWPGNVRELKNAVKRMLVFSNHLTVDLLPEDILKALGHGETGELESDTLMEVKEGVEEEASPTYNPTSAASVVQIEVGIGSDGLMEKMEKKMILQALRVAKGDRYRVAHMLGISPPTVYRKIKRYGLSEERVFREMPESQ